MHGLLMLADDSPSWKWDPVEQAQAACEGGAAAVQLRVKHAGDRAALVWARRIRELTRSCGADFYVNDRFDLALAAQADGVHVGQDDMPPAQIRLAVGSRLAIGLSTHDLDQARRACAEPVDYIAFGPVFGTLSKESEYSARGLAGLAEIVRTCAPRRVVAIGGITAENAGEVANAGASAIAVISCIAQAPEPVAAARTLLAAFLGAAQ
jgi:thiamine-phosphate pyrophosphorylase